MAENICVEYCRDRSFNKRESATEKKQKCPIGMRQEAAIRNINSTKRCKTSFLTFFVLGEATNADTYHAPRIRRCPRTFRTECSLVRVAVQPTPGKLPVCQGVARSLWPHHTQCNAAGPFGHADSMMR